MTVLGVGIIGCGEATQLIHLPALQRLPDAFRVVALCDLSRTVLDAVGARASVTHRFLHHTDLLARPDVDAVLIANPNSAHAPTALAAMAAGKHVLLEKPAAMHLAEIDALLEAESRSGVIVQVGYMRRYAAAFLRACALVAELRLAGDIRHARVHDFIGDNALIVGSLGGVARGRDADPAALAEGLARDAAGLRAALGPAAPPDLVGAYRLMLGLSSHDLSAMRELLGNPRRVIAATQRGGCYLTATFDYGDFVCLFESGYDALARFDASIEVYGSTRVIRVRYDTPYVPNLPVRLDITEFTPERGLTQCTEQPTWGDPFVDAWSAFHANVTAGRLPKTSLADARLDLQLMQDMLARLDRSPAHSA